MTAQVEEILHTFDGLPDDEKRELVTELLRRSLATNAPPLSDEELVGAAEEVFLRLDGGEAGNA